MQSASPDFQGSQILGADHNLNVLDQATIWWNVFVPSQYKQYRL